jgi:hypothetical protein
MPIDSGEFDAPNKYCRPYSANLSKERFGNDLGYGTRHAKVVAMAPSSQSNGFSLPRAAGLIFTVWRLGGAPLRARRCVPVSDISGCVNEIGRGHD